MIFFVPALGMAYDMCRGDISQVEHGVIGCGYPGWGYVTLTCPLRLLPIFVEEVAAVKVPRRLHPNGAEEVNKWLI